MRLEYRIMSYNVCFLMNSNCLRTVWFGWLLDPLFVRMAGVRISPCSWSV